jgi:acid phosphatase
MLKKFSCLLLLSSMASPLQAKEVAPNLTILKEQLAQYYDSKEYERDFVKVVKDAQGYLKQRVAENKKSSKPKKLAIVFDIDDTMISNYKFFKQNDFSFQLDTIFKNVAAADCDPLPSVQLYKDAREQNVAVFFLTGRKEMLRDATVKNLQKAGLDKWDDLILKPNDMVVASASDYKAPQRKLISDKGYDIIISMGDQQSDLDGGYAEKTYKLPNPYYFIP